MGKEIWKDIDDYEGFYQVSNLGRVRSLDNWIWNGTGFFLKPGKVLIPRKTKTGYQSRCNIRGKNYSLGSFKTELEAFNAYKQAKENYLKELANKWKDKIDERAYNALMNYQVEITD